MTAQPGDITRLLAQIREGRQDAERQLAPLVYAELRQMAASHMRRERPNHTLQATALVSEAYLRMADGNAGSWQNRAHFFAIAANAMRQVLLDYARRRHAGKRGGAHARQVELEEHLTISEDKLDDVLAVDQALQRLSAIDPRQSRIVELRFFAGLSVEEAGEVMNLSPITIKREWRSARAWLLRELKASE